ncbi:AraC family transcriptional regulator [Paenibacillus alkaliterrae]|uniref:AraC family transcriptional regulator n=1 Tax=Paenibacillus alkaliterrae TaxID=320909 RepID=UPI001F1A3DFB|nr:AraC family transcriptional regulator [Paenibacillus alkaliterrae]MCF2938036.1 AraC family transcriptional regulator [Paenibacillus alkaliterrae]
MKILIVDDEVIIRTGLSTVINWKELGFELLTPAASAEEAIVRIPDERPHIVLTDIRMTGKDGLELTAEVKQLLPDSEIIILTGYEDFSYTQQAIREGVSDYLLKTSPPKEIIKAAMKAKQRILNRWAALKQGHIQQTAFRDSLLERLVTEGRLDEQSLAQIPQLLPKVHPDAKSFQALIIAASGWGDDTIYANSLHFAVENMVRELLDCETLLRKDCVLLILSRHQAVIDLYKVKLELDRISRKLKCKLFIAAGSCVRELRDLKTSYAEASFAFTFKGFAGREDLVAYDDVKGCVGGRTICTQEEEEQIISILKNGNAVELRYWVNQAISAQLADPAVTPSSFRTYSNSVIISGHRWLERVMQSLGEEEPLPEQLLQQPADMSVQPDEALYKHLHTLMGKYQEMAAGERVTYIKRAMAYICDHLDKNLTLQQVAKHVHLNPNHFSEVFKRETGLTYIEFVTRERIRRAMKLLSQSPMKISEVARHVGYEDVKYFSQLFKKVSGKTPSEYRIKN